jgi:FkbM family methyltransferase
MMRLARRCIPASYRRQLREELFRWLDLRWDLTSGLKTRICNYGDWLVYNEIFVRGEYDRALELALDSPADRSPIHIVDIGANVGFFTLRAAERLQRSMETRDFTVTAVEANPRCAREFRQRIFIDNGLSDRVTLVHGLIGERTGTATLYEDSLFQRGSYRGVKVAYIDLSSLLSSLSGIHLLKCDIEGAEQRLLETYPDVFRKVKVAIFELHANLCDADRCRELLTEYGFTHGETLRNAHPYSIYCAWR